MTPEADDAALLRVELDQLRSENDRLSERIRDVGTEAAPRRHRLRRLASIVLVILATALLPASVLGVWLRGQVTDTDRYVETVAPLIRDPAVQAAAIERVVTALDERVDLDAVVAAALPERAAFLAVPISSGMETLIRDVVTRVLASDQFAALWDTANRAAHTQLVNVLTSTNEGVVEIDLTAAVTEVGNRLEALGIDQFADAGSEPVTFELLRSEEIAQLQAAFGVFDRLASLLPWVVLLLLAAAIVVAPDRRRGAVAAASGVVVGSALLLVAVGVGRGLYLEALPPDASVAANESIYDALTRFLRGGTRALLVVGLVGLVAALLAGPSGSARRVRSGLSRLGGGAGGALGESAYLRPIGRFAARNVLALRLAIGVLALTVLASTDRPSAGTVLWIAGIAAVALMIVEVVARTGEANTRTDGDLAAPNHG